jgi:asparagine synthase (glutamine-hydrolysing)
MTRTLRHRGPDDSGTWSARFGSARDETAVALGHTRLSILDLSERGHQPMISDDGAFVISYNGEVYNFREVRTELEGLGARFRSDSDTEVVLQAWRTWGSDSLRRLNGMFAFAIWDRTTGRLALARDRTGIKPLYYRWSDGVLSFGSELRALRAHRSFRAQLDRGALGTYLRVGWLTGERTLYRDTFRLLPGHVLIWQKGAIATHCFWKLSNQQECAPRAFENTVDDLEDILGSAVEGCLISDVPLGAFLSGGIDSSAVVALMKERARGAVRTFSIGFAELEFDEAPYARAIARSLGTQHTEMYVDRKAALGILDELPWIYDEPLADVSAIPTLLLSRLTRDHVTVALSGDGGDELFGGYDRYQKLARLLPGLRAPPVLRRSIGALAECLPASGLRNGLVRLGSASDPAELAEGFLADLEGSLARKAARAPGSVSIERYLEVFRAVQSRSPVRRAMYAEACTYMTDDVLVKVDRASMSVGLEVRVPVLDHRVVEFAFGLPDTQLTHGNRTKAPLRALLYRRIPPVLLERPKQGFGFPLRALLGEQLDAWVAEYLSPERIAAQSILAPDAVAKVVKEARGMGERGDGRLWRLLCFQRWLAAHHPRGLEC